MFLSELAARLDIQSDLSASAMGETSCILLPAVCKFNLKYRANVVDWQAMVRDLLAGAGREVGQLLQVEWSRWKGG